MDLVKIFFKYQNEFIDEEKLLMLLGEKLIENSGKELETLIKDIGKIKEEYQNNSTKRYEETINKMLEYKPISDILDNMNAKDLMLLITDYIKCRVIPNVDQKLFDEMVEEAINDGDAAKEDCWRLAMTYDETDINLNKIEDYIISTKDAYYVTELMSGVDRVDNEKMINKVIATNDKEFIKRLLEDNFLSTLVDKKVIAKLQAVYDKMNI